MGGGGRGMGMGFGGYNETSVKQVLSVTEQQWQQIKPKLDKVRQLTTESRSSVALMGTGRGRRGGEETAAPAAEPNAPRWVRPSQRAQMTQQELTEADKAAEALLDLIEKKDSDPKQIQAKVEALRAARQKAQKDLVAAQGELRKALDARQQAIMTLMGYLD
jgi:Spy/CpxP family protein refolding chaperone